MRPLTRDIIVLGIPWNTEVQEIVEHFEAFGQVLWVKTKEPGRTGSKRGYCIIRMVNKQAEGQIDKRLHILFLLLFIHWPSYLVKNARSYLTSTFLEPTG